jgi:hypothetical protein
VEEVENQQGLLQAFGGNGAAGGITSRSISGLTL